MSDKLKGTWYITCDLFFITVKMPDNCVDIKLQGYSGGVWLLSKCTCIYLSLSSSRNIIGTTCIFS